MESKKTIDLCTKVSIGLLLIAGFLSLFDIGPSMQPLYQYIPAKVHILFVCSILGTSSSILVVYLIYMMLNDKTKHIYKTGLLLLIMTSISNLFLGANIIFIVASVITLIMLSINVASEGFNFNLSKIKIPNINLSKLTLPKFNLPKINLSKINFPKINLSKTFINNRKVNVRHPQKRYNVKVRSPRRYPN